MIRMPGRSHTGRLPALTEDEVRICERLRKHVRILAGDIGERSIWRPGSLNASAQYIEESFRSEGCSVARQEFDVQGTIVANIEAVVNGTSGLKEIVLVGAHYDTVPGSPGANDNASGIAAILELARLLSSRNSTREIRLVAFANEEPPFFRTRYMGSRVYASRSRKQGEDIVAMLSVETIGHYSHAKGSQTYPFPFGFFYPGSGNFIGFVGNLASQSLVRRCVASFRQHTAFPSEALCAPGWVTGVGWSDHWSFWREGYPAAMITDTALFRDQCYHTISDTPEKLDYDSSARVVGGIGRLVTEFAVSPA